MDKDETLKLLNLRRAEIRERVGVKRLALFGSVARDDASGKSDVDALVEFEGSTTFRGYMGLRSSLEDLFQRPVDLVTEAGLRPVFRPYIEVDAIEIS